MKVLGKLGLISPKVSITLLMQGIHHVVNFLFPTAACDITFLNGVVHVLGMSCFPFLFFSFNHSDPFRPANRKELFNLRHASARNVIERVFGVLKRRYRILQLAPEYNLDIQARIPAALCAVHNFILKFDPLDKEPILSNSTIDRNDNNEIDINFTETEPETSASIRRDQIAEAMWQSYQQYCAEMSESDLESDGLLDDDDDDE